MIFTSLMMATSSFSDLERAAKEKAASKRYTLGDCISDDKNKRLSCSFDQSDHLYMICDERGCTIYSAMEPR